MSIGDLRRVRTVTTSTKEKITHLVSFPESFQLVSEKQTNLRVVKDASDSPRQKVRVPPIARLERHRKGRSLGVDIEMSRSLGEASRFELMSNSETTVGRRSQ